jgi:filamentous hemagglutinin
MNKNLFRIIFNKRRGQLMAVAETSSSQGKGSIGESVVSDHPATADSATVSISALSFAVLCALGAVLWALPTPNAQAQVVAYRNAPGNQQPTVLQTANGVPQVDIQTPSAAGVSRNIYSQFDVQSNGVILNNSRTSVQTQQGGWVQGNPWLATGSARVILNEVNSSNPSYLNGYVEVAGQRAEVVIANPSGISVNGGGFINTSKATLTTGTPIVNGGSLDGYRVQGGNISINGNGLDLSTTDYSAILARAVQVNAGIWANELKVVTGANQIDASSLGANTTPVTTNIAGTGAVPSFALDVAQIGGMYAGKIHLIGTEQGLGVRSAGTIGSTGGDLVLQNNGWLTTTGTLQASANLQITTQGNITNSGTLYASNDQTLNATGSVTNSGVIAAQGNTSITANSLSSTSASVVGAGIKTDGTLVSSGNLNIATTQALAANGKNLAAGNITVTGSNVDLSGSQTGAANIGITANSGNVNTANATVATFGTAGVLAITAKTNNDQTLNNTHGVLSAGQLNLDVANLTNAQGQITQTGVGDTSIVLTSPTSTFNNTGGTVTVNSANLNLSANTLTNTDGKIQHAGTGALSVAADTLNNVRGQVASNSNVQLEIGTQLNNTDGVIFAAKDLNVSAGFAVAQLSGGIELNNTRGLIQATAGSLNLNVGNLDNTQGSVYAHADLSLVSTGAITNTGFIAAQGNATLSANSLSSSSTGVLGAGIKADGTLANSGDLKITTTQVLSANGQNLAAGNSTLSGSTVNLSGSQTGGSNIGITATSGEVNTSNATVATAGTLSIAAKVNNSQTLNNTQGVLSASQLNVDVANFNNTLGQAIQTGMGDTSIVLSSPTGTLNNTNGTIATNSANLNFSADSLTNTDGKIQHAGTGTLHVTANTLNDQRGKIVSNNALFIDAGVVDHRAASTAAKNINLNAASLNNTEGAIVQTGNGAMAVSVTQGLDNTAGTLASNGNLTVAAQSLTNNQGQVSALGDLTTNLNTTTGVLSNLQGLVAAKGNVTITAASVDNTLGTLVSVDNNLSITTKGATTNDSGKIQAAQDITLNNAGLSNTRMTNALATSSTPYGSIIGRNVGINTNTQTLNNAGGTIAASQTANLQTGAFNNNGGLVQTGSDLTINTHGQTLTNTNAANYTSSNTALIGKGGIASQSTSTLTTGDLNNDAGYIGSKGAMTANSANISNTQSGQIQGLGNLSLTAGNGSSTGAINNTGGLIRSAATTSLSAGTVTNSNTSGTGLGIEGLDVSVSTTTLRNDRGGIRADNNVTVTSTGTVNNSAGLMSAGNNLTLQDVQAQANRTLAITNTNGTLLAGQSLVVAANSIGGDGSILSKGNLNLALNADFFNSGQVIANGNATINTTGNVNNSGKLQAGNTLNLTANNIDNTVTGEISANTTQVNANSTLTNRGLIDGVDTQVNANTVNNIGTGRIYGDHLSIAAVNLTNDTETIGGVTKAGTIAARDRLDLGISGTLTNREHALIYSVGDMAIGGALDANRRATGSATTLNNNSATIEAGRNLSLSSTTLNNTNDHFAYETRVATTELDVREDIDSGLYRVFTRTTYLPYQTASDPAQILAGGDINLNSSNAINYASHIVAGGALNIGSSTLANTDVMATKSIRDVGTTYTLVHVPGSGICGKISINCVHAHDEWQTAPYDSTANSTVSVAQETAASNSGAQVTSLSSGTVNQTLGAVGSADARTGNITQANVSAQQVGSVLVNTANGASTSSSTSAGQVTTQTLSVRGAHPNTTLPTSSLFKNNPSPTSAYLIETDTRFIDRKLWLGSDYMTQSLSLDPTVTQKRLGDGFYEQKLIREQVAELTGRRFLADYTSDEQEYKALMTSAITFGQTYNLRPGIALTAQQIAQLTSDIVWLVEQTVTLPDGSSQKVLVPQVYVKVQPGDLDGSGALLAGKDVNINLSGDLTNSGTIAGRNVVSLTTENVNNLGGRIGGNDVSVAARQDLNNIGGSIGAINSLSATAGRDLNIQTTTQSTNTQVGSANFSRTGVDRVAGLYVSGANGTMVASAGRDLNIVAGVVSNAGNGATSLSADNNFTLASVKTGEQNNITWDADNHLNYGNTQTVGSTINGGGNVNLKAGNDLTATAANVQATKALGVQSGGSVNILAGENTTNLDEAHKTSSGSGFLGGSTLVTRNVSNTSTAVGSNFGGGTVDIAANNKDINVKGSNVVSDNGTTLTAGGNVNIESATNTTQQSNYSQETKSGFSISSIGANPIGWSYSKTKQSDDNQSTSTTAAASTVGSVGGNVSISAGNQYKQVGSDVLTPQGDINITAKTVDIQEARETNKQRTEQKFEQTSISTGLKGGIIDSVQATTQAVQAAKDSSSTRNQNLNALIAFAKGSDAYEQGKTTQDAYDKNGVMGKPGEDGKTQSGAAAASGIKVSVSIGSSSSQSNSTTTTDTGAGSTVKAGGNVNIKATGQGADEGNLTIQGSNVSAAKDVNLSATQDVNILASADTESNRSSNKSSSTSVGVSVGIGPGGAGLSLDIAASRGKGQANSDSTTYNNSHVSAGNQVNITSGADTNVIGGNVKANQVTANVGGNLNVESLQDKAVSEASQKTTGIALSIPIVGTGGSASFSQSKQNSNSNYASVNEQSGIKAGEGGFAINVGGNTDLKGATVTGSSDASKNTLATNTLTTSDINNSMSASASSSGVSVGTNMMDGKYAMAKALASNALNNGSANQSDASTTTSAISGATVTVGNKTTDTSKDSLTDSNGKAVSTDTSNTNRTLAKADVASLQKSAQEQQASNMLAFKAAVAIADDGLKKMAKPQLRQVFCVAEPCSNDQLANTAKIQTIAQGLMNANPDMTKDQATTLAIAKIAGVDGDPAKADPKYSGSDPSRVTEVDGSPVKVRNIQIVPVTVEDLQSLPNDQKVNSSVFANGIFNNEQRAGELAIQQTPKLDPNDSTQRQQIQSSGTVLQGATYLVSTDKSNNSAGEYVTAGVEKLAEILGIPTPAAELKAQVIKALSTNNETGQTDNPVNSIGHSRGTMTDVNTYNVLGAEGFKNPNLKVIENNPAAKQERIEQSASQVTKPENVQIFAPKNDPVATFVGGYGTGNNIDAIKEVPSMATTSNSVHSSPGSGAVGSNSADVNKPFSYQGLDIDQLNKAKQPQTNAILEQVQANPKPIPIAPSADPATKLQDQVQKDSNAQMNQLLNAPAAPLTPPASEPQVPSSRLEQLNQFKQGN